MSDCETNGLIPFLIFTVVIFVFPFVWKWLEGK